MYKGIIYCAISPSNKKYYGQTIGNLKNRIRGHEHSTDNTLFHNAVRKYKNEMKWCIIETFEFFSRLDLITKLNEIEMHWIEKDKTFVNKYGKEFGYNMTMGGQGVIILKHTKETKEKISKSLKGRPKPESAKENYRLANLGAKNPMYGKTSARKGVHLSQKEKDNLRKLYLGKTFEEIYGIEKAKKIKEKISKKLKNKNKGQKRTEETKRKISIAGKKRFESLSERQKIKDRTKEAMNKPEIREKIKLGLKKYHMEKKSKMAKDFVMECQSSSHQ